LSFQQLFELPEKCCLLAIFLCRDECGSGAPAAIGREKEGWREAWWLYLDRDPSLDPIRAEPGYQAMLTLVSRYWRSRGYCPDRKRGRPK
jgi:hypothetical protein